MTAATLDALAYVPAWDFGVPGDGSDQTVPLQAIVDGLPAEGGNVMLKGDVQFTSLDLHGKHNVRILGMAGQGAGASLASMLRSRLAGGTAIDARDTVSVELERLWVGALSPSFTGKFIDYGRIVTGSAFARLADLYASVPGGTFASMTGTTQSKIERVEFNGRGTALGLVVSPGQFCNNLLVERADFVNQSGGYAVVGSAEGLTFQSDNWEGGVDGKGRAWQSSLFQDFKAVSFCGCTFYDAGTPGYEWIEAYTGEGFTFAGNDMGGADPHIGNSYGLALGGGGQGVRGVAVLGNVFRYMTAAVSIVGSIASQNSVRGGVIGANSCFGGTSPQYTALLVNFGQAQDVVLLPGPINALPAGVLGSRLAFPGLRAFSSNSAALSAGMAIGEVYRSSTSGALMVVL